MFSKESLDKVLEKDVITQEVAEKLLSIYVCEADWWPHVVRLHKQLSRKHGKESASELVRETIAFTILLPADDKTIQIDCKHPENNLFKWRNFHQYDSKNWFEELQSVIRQDAKIAEYRQQVLNVGVIDPIDYQPFCRQAYKWMCDHAESSGVDLTEERLKRFRGLVMAYGGAVVSYMFEKHAPAIKKVTNWRTPYFLERAIFDTYSLDQVIKIKQAEVDKTNPKLVKQIRKG